MVQSLQSLYAYGRAFDFALIAASVAAAVAAIVSLCSYAARGRCAGWRERRAQRRYVRAGMRDLERYLTRASTTAARRPPGPPGPGRWPGSGR